MDSDDLSPNDPRIGKIDQNVAILREWLSAVEDRAPENDEKWLMVSMLKSAIRAHDHLRAGWNQNDSTYVAWACRNLLELRIIAKFVAPSAANRKRFVFDMFIDLKETITAQKTIAESIAPEVVPDHDTLLASLQRSSANIGFSESKYIRTSDLADTLGFADVYSAMRKATSKLVHSSALSVLGVEQEDSGQYKRNVFVLAGGQYLGEMLTDLIPVAQELIGDKPSSAPPPKA